MNTRLAARTVLCTALVVFLATACGPAGTSTPGSELNTLPVSTTTADETNSTEALYLAGERSGDKTLRGFVDSTGAWAIEPKDWLVGEFSDGLAFVSFDGGDTYGYIDSAGRVAIDPQFRDVRPFSGGLAAFSRDGEIYGFIDKTGEVAIEPAFYIDEDRSFFSSGLVPVGLSKDGPWGYIDGAGEWVVQPELQMANKFFEGLALVSQHDGTYGFIDPTGKVVISREANQFSDGLAVASRGSDSLLGYIDKTGEFVIPPQFEIAGDFSEGLAWASYDGEAFGFIDVTGRMVIAPQFSFPGGPLKDYRFSSGLAKQRASNGLWGYIDTKGDWVIAPTYEVAEPFSGELASVELDSGWAFIDKTGRFVCMKVRGE
jgi:hypothetical protein